MRVVIPGTRIKPKSPGVTYEKMLANELEVNEERTGREVLG